MKQDSSRDIAHGRGSGAPTEALAESRTSLSEWQTDPELKFYWAAGITRFMLPESSTTLGDARPALGRQRTIKNWLGLFRRRSKSEKALASPTSPRSPKTIPRP